MEAYGNLAQTTLTANYVPASGVLQVANTAASGFPTSATFTVAVVAAGTNTVRVLLRVTAITDSTHFAVTAEGADSSGSSGDTCIGVLSAAAINQIRADIHQFGVAASLPSTTGQIKGNTYKATDTGESWHFDGSSWVADKQWPTTQANVTGSRAIGTIYHNTSDFTMHVNVSIFSGTNATMVAVSDASATPSTTVQAAFVPNTGNANGMTFIVLPGNYYQVTVSAGAPTLYQWVESK